jgi:hypothetical protein
LTVTVQSPPEKHDRQFALRAHGPPGKDAQNLIVSPWIAAQSLKQQSVSASQGSPWKSTHPPQKRWPAAATSVHGNPRQHSRSSTQCLPWHVDAQAVALPRTTWQ